MTDKIDQGIKDYEDCVERVQAVLTYVGEDVLYDDVRMDVHFEALYNMMAERGYSVEDVDDITERI